MKEELKPCPCPNCGYINDVKISFFSEGWFVYSCASETEEYETIFEAVEAWNKMCKEYQNHRTDTRKERGE